MLLFLYMYLPGMRVTPHSPQPFFPPNRAFMF